MTSDSMSWSQSAARSFPSLPLDRIRTPDWSRTTAGRARVAAYRRICLDASVAAAVAGVFIGHIFASVAFACVWTLAIALTGGQETRLISPGFEDARRLSRAALGVAAVGAVVASTPLPLPPQPSGQWLTLVATAWVLSMGHRGLERLWRRNGRGTRVMVAGPSLQSLAIVEDLRRSGNPAIDVVGLCVPTLPERTVPGVEVTQGMDNLATAASRLAADAVVALPCESLSAPTLRQAGRDLGARGIQLFLDTGLGDVDTRRVTFAPAGGAPLVHVRAPEIRSPRRFVTEIAHQLAAAVLLILGMPVLVAVGLAIRRDSYGPAIYRQLRIGRDGRPFQMWKFRTMVLDAEDRRVELESLVDRDGPLFKLREDPRVTRLGRLLRKYSLDELPQLVNVLLGQMALVGPRPALPAEVAEYDPTVRRRLVVKPGLTGLWQVSGRSDLSWEEGIRLDLRYVDNWSLGLDAKILVQTVRAVVSHTGAY